MTRLQTLSIPSLPNLDSFQHALASKAQQLEQEGQQLRESLVQKQNHIKMLERRVSTLELELQDMAAKVGRCRGAAGLGSYVSQARGARRGICG